jgi:tetratricopeptide (TPR) repeat protein
MKKALEDHILVMLDVAAPEGKELAETFHVSAFPTFAVLDAAGEALFSWIGYGRPDSWIESLSGALADPITIAARQDRYRSDPSFQDAVTLGKIAQREGHYREAESYYRQAETLDARAAEEADVDMLLFRTIFRGVGDGQFTIQQAGEQVKVLLGNETVEPAHALEAAERLTSVREQVGDEVIIPYLKMARPFVQNIEDPDLEGRQTGVLAEYALIVDQDHEKAIGLKRASFSPGWETDPDILNEFAWWCFENEINLEEAEQLSRRSIELSEPNAEQANFLDTLAELVNLRGETGEALELIQKAVELNPDSKYLKDQRTRFQEILSAQK